MRKLGTLLLIGVCAFVCARQLVAQTVQSANADAFDVAIVKANTQNPGERRAGFQPGGRFVGINVSLSMLLGAAFGTPDAMFPGFQISGGPDWMNAAGFDVEAKAPTGASPEQLRSMLRALLQDRFHLATHVETRDSPIYVLVLARRDGKLGPQLRPSAGDCVYGAAANPNGLPHCEDRFGPPQLKARRVSVAAATMDVFASRLQSQVSRRVVNRTGLAGKFDVDLEFNYGVAPPVAADGRPPQDDAISIFAAIEDQLGLSLQADRGPVDILVVDRAERPKDD